MRARLRRAALALGGASALLVAWLWFSMLSPWGYTPPADLPAIERGVAHRVFAYGTLRQPLLRWLVIGRRAPTWSAILPDHRRDGLDVRRQAGARTEGEVFVVDADELRRLDRYERLGVRYERFAAELASGQVAWVYRRLEGP